MSKRVYIVGGAGLSYDILFTRRKWQVVTDPSDSDLFLFCGGADVHPSLYGEMEHPTSHCHLARDIEEAAAFEYAVAMDIPCVGICRGGQFLNVMSGGTMYQHVDGHTASHDITDLQTGRKIPSSSTHHQMMCPSKEGTIIATASLATTKEYMEDEEVKTLYVGSGEPDIEVCFYADTNSLCFQPHPEFFDKGHPCEEYFFELINKYLGV